LHGHVTIARDSCYRGQSPIHGPFSLLTRHEACRERHRALVDSKHITGHTRVGNEINVEITGRPDFAFAVNLSDIDVEMLTFFNPFAKVEDICTQAQLWQKPRF